MPGEDEWYVALLARGMGWTEFFVRWELPLCRGLGYVVALEMMEGRLRRWVRR